MSWSVEGRVYHSHEEYQRARAREREQRLRRTVERLHIPPADTSRLEKEIAAAEARDHAVRRLARQVDREAAERRDLAQAHRQRIAEAFADVERQEARLATDLEGWRQDLGTRIEQLEEQRRAQAAAVSASLNQELDVDRHDAEAARRRSGELLSKARTVLDGLAPERLRDLGLDASPVRALCDKARGEEGVAALELARRAWDQAASLESNAAYREARLGALQEVYKMEVEELRHALRFEAEDRADLVGEGSSALDAPLQRELDQVLERVTGIRYYEDHEARFADVGKVLDELAVRVSDLASQVRDFDRLEEERLDLVRNRLGSKLKEVLGEDVQLLEVAPGELGLQPVEARFRTARGEKVDCSVSIDGTLRIHHYDHVSQASCAESARILAKNLPDLMALNGQPRLDVATGAAPGDAAPQGRSETQPTGRNLS